MLTSDSIVPESIQGLEAGPTATTAAAAAAAAIGPVLDTVQRPSSNLNLDDPSSIMWLAASQWALVASTRSLTARLQHTGRLGLA